MEFAIAQQGMIQVVESNILRVSIALPGIYAWSATHNRPLNEVSIIGSKSGNTRRGPELQPLPSARELIRTPISSEQTLTFSSLLISAPGHAWALVDSVPLKEREVRVVPLVSSGSVLLRLTSLRRDAVAGKRPRVHVQLTPRPTQADTVSNLLTTQSLSTSLSDALLATHEVLQWNGIAPGNYTISIRSELAAHTWMGHIEVESGRDTLVDDGLLGFLSTPIRYIHLSFQDIQNAEDFLGVDVACKDGSGSSIIRPFRPTNKVGDAAINPDFPREQWIALSPQDFAITLGDNDALLAPKTLRLLPWGVQVPTRLGVCVPDDNLIIAVERIKPRTIQVMLDDTPCQLASVRVGQWTEKGRYPAEVTCFGKPVPALAVTGSQFEFGLSDNYRVEVHLVLSQDGREWVCSMNSAELNEGILRLYSKDLAPDYIYFAFISQSKYNNVEDYLIHGVRFIGHDGLPLRSRPPTRVQLKTAELGNSAKAYSSVWKVEVPDSAHDLTIPRGLNLETSARLDVLDVLAKGRHREPSDPFIVWCGKE